MAYADYRLCDVCGEKAFYDANLNYEIKQYDGRLPYRIAGKPQLPDPKQCDRLGERLDYLGDWAVLCSECAKTHKCQIVEKGTES